ncbi:MAG: hypothetical protein MUD14_10110 [Hydrococcus sp. Prado102]|jgi:hypothetical protein|nr:hypothetical protein [Hydrococcus sp. Prado102]
MTLDRVLTILGIVGGLSTIALWISKARESDLVLNITLQHLTKDLDRIRAELIEMRSQHIESSTHTGRRIAITRTILFKFINHYNNPEKRNANFEFVDVKELED